MGESIDVEALLKWLVEQRFHHTSAVELPGEFSVRGGILDIFAPDWQQPVRIELFGDEIESMRRFDMRRSAARRRSRRSKSPCWKRAPRPGHLSDYLPASSWFLLVEPEQIDKEGRHYLSSVGAARDVHAWTR